MKIEKNIPFNSPSQGRPAKYPFRDMDVGDSMFFPDEPMGTQSNPAMVARANARNWGWKFATRKEGNGVRVWRTA